MFSKKTKDEDPRLDEAIDSLYDELNSVMADSDEFPKIVEQLDKLYKIRALRDEKQDRVSKDTLFMIGGNLAGILLILNFERAGVVASKALGFVLKTR